MSDIFISYASADRSRVKPLVDELRRRGWSVWWDPTILPGETWDVVIEAALTQARCVIVLWTRNSIQSQWVKTEADDARRRGILVPALLDEVVIPLAFRQIQAAKLVQWSGVFPNAEFEKLAQAVTKILSKEAGLTTAAVPRPDPVVPVAARRRHVWSFRSSRRTMVASGAALLVCVAGSAWYFASGHPEASPDKASPNPATVIAPVGPARTEPGRASSPARINLKDGLKYVFIPAGSFVMGCSPGDTDCNDDEKPPHAEQIANGFWLGQTEVTQAAWKQVNGGDNPSHFKGDQLPVESVDWNQATSYCQAIGGRLPTEKEWEYAARGGTAGSRYGALDAIAWYRDNSDKTTHPVGLKQPNAFGLYDMLGNLWEWTADDHDAEHKLQRGGSWVSSAGYVRVSLRGAGEPTRRASDDGFRCVGELRVGELR